MCSKQIFHLNSSVKIDPYLEVRKQSSNSTHSCYYQLHANSHKTNFDPVHINRVLLQVITSACHQYTWKIAVTSIANLGIYSPIFVFEVLHVTYRFLPKHITKISDISIVVLKKYSLQSIIVYEPPVYDLGSTRSYNAFHCREKEKESRNKKKKAIVPNC